MLGEVPHHLIDDDVQLAHGSVPQELTDVELDDPRPRMTRRQRIELPGGDATWELATTSPPVAEVPDRATSRPARQHG